MALQFTPYPVPRQEEEPHPINRIASGVQNALGAYLQFKNQRDEQQARKQQRLLELAKARAEYGEDFMSGIGSSQDAPGKSFLPPSLSITPQQVAAAAPVAENPYKAYEDPLGLPGVAAGAGATASVPAGAAAALSAQAPGSAAPTQAPQPQKINSVLDITPDTLAEIRKKKGTRGLKEFQDTQSFMTGQNTAKAQINQFGISNASKLRDDYVKASGNFKTVSENIQNMQSIANRAPSAAGDISLVFSFMKLNDPSSTVREGEYATAANAAGIPDRIRALYNKAVDGQTLAGPQRQDIIRTAGSLYDGWANKQKTVDDQYRGISQRSGVNPEDVIINQGVPGINLSSYTSPQTAAQAAPVAAPAPVAGMVRVVAPNGKAGMIPEANLQKAIQSGYKRAQ